MYLNPMELPPGGPAATLACAILASQADRLDRLNADVTDELGRYARSRERIDSLLTRLIDELDDLDGDPDLEAVSEDEGTGEVDDDLGAIETDSDLGWTEREARTGFYLRGTLGDDEPTLGSREHGNGGTQAWWGLAPTPPKLDEVEGEDEHGGDVLDEGENATWSEAGSLSGDLAAGPDDMEHALASTMQEDRLGVFSHAGRLDTEEACEDEGELWSDGPADNDALIAEDGV